MAQADDDPYVALGRKITSGTGAGSAAPVEDPYISAGRAITAPVLAAPIAPTTPTAPVQPVNEYGSVTDELGHPLPSPEGVPTTWQGVVRGARDFIDKPAELLARGADKAGVNTLLSTPTGEDVAALNRNDLASYEAQRPPGFDIPRAVGNLAAVVPMSIGAGNVLRAAPVVGPFLAGVGGGGLAARVASGAAGGAVQGAGISAIGPNPSNEDLRSRLVHGAVTGAAIGGALPIVGSAASALLGGSSALTPERAALGQLARDTYGIELKAPQLGMSSTLRYANNALKMVPGSGAGAEDAAVQSQFNRAVSRTFGEDAPQITPDVLSKAQSRIGGVMNKIEKDANVSLDEGFLSDAARIENNARSSLTDPEYAVVRRQLDGVMKNLQSDGTIAGTTYGNLIHKGSPLDAALSSGNSNISMYAGQIKAALQDSLKRSLSAEDAAAYQQARTQYKALKTVEPLTLRADTTGGAAPSTGDISAPALRAAVNKAYGSGVAQEAPGVVPLHDLARIGQMMKEPPSSGSSERGSLLYAGSRLAELAGAAAMGHYAGLAPASAAIGAGVVGGRLAGAYLRSNLLANRMIDSALNTNAGNTLLSRVGPLAAPVGTAATLAPQGAP